MPWSRVSKMIFPVLLIFLSGTLAHFSRVGDLCRLKNGKPGVCATPIKCESLMEELRAVKPEFTLCGYSYRYEPMVCCPPNSPKPPTVPRKLGCTPKGDGRGAISRQKCAEYSKFVYTMKYPFSARRPINVSQCAIRSQTLVVGGTKAERMEFPHMAAIGFILEDGSIDWRCGGSIISERFVLTAAHCTNSGGWDEAEWVRVGDLNLVRSDDGAKPVDIRVIDRIRHPNYKPPAKYNDIALLRLVTDINFNGWTRPACLHTAPTTGTKKAIATGWGRVNWTEEDTPDDLLKVTLPLIDSRTCKAQWAQARGGFTSYEFPNGIVGDWLICAGTKGKDTCQGDSGGPLVVFRKKAYCMYDIVGVTSLGKFCGFEFPGIYTRVYHYIQWIESIVWGRG